MFKAILFLSLFLNGFSEESKIEELSEAIGHMIGKNLEALGLDFDLDAVVKGLKEESEGKASPLNEDECIQVINALQDEKINTANEQELHNTDTLSNGTELHDEDYPFPTPNSPKYR